VSWGEYKCSKQVFQAQRQLGIVNNINCVEKIKEKDHEARHGEMLDPTIKPKRASPKFGIR
jgi:hypothetical protein